MLVLVTSCQRSPEIPGVVVGSSMAPTLLGEHYLIECDDCRFELRFDLDQRSLLNPLVTCGHCGQRLDFRLAVRQPAQTVSIIPKTPIERWDVVAFQIPWASKVGIKRVLGLPGEKIAFYQGNVLAGGVLQKKNWQQQMTSRILVHDTQFTPQSTLPSRWSPVAESPVTESLVDELRNSEWQKGSPFWHFNGAPQSQSITRKDSDEINLDWHWLSYQHWRGCRHLGDRFELFPIEDLDVFNQSLSRSLNPTADLFLEIDGSLSSDSIIGWLFFRGETRLIVELDFRQKKLKLIEQNTRPQIRVDQAQINPNHCGLTRIFELNRLPESARRLQISTFDNQFSLAVGEQLLLTTDISNVRGELEADKIVWIGAKQGSFDIHRIKIYRDIYYFADEGPSSLFPVDQNGYFVVGDNVSFSTDSRHWQTAGISGGIVRPSILGKVRITED